MAILLAVGGITGLTPNNITHVPILKTENNELIKQTTNLKKIKISKREIKLPNNNKN